MSPAPCKHRGRGFPARPARPRGLEQVTWRLVVGRALAVATIFFLVWEGPLAQAQPTPAQKGNTPKAKRPTAVSYWLGRKPDPSKSEYVFDVPVPADLVAVLLCNGPRYLKFRPAVKQFQWEAEDRVYDLVQNPIAWEGKMIEGGQLAFDRSGVSIDAWTTVSTAVFGWAACQEQLKAQAQPKGTWYYVAPIMVQVPGKANPHLTLNLDADRPYDVHRDPPTKKPQIVALVHHDTLFIAWQSWGGSAPTGRIAVSRIGTGELASGKLAAVREVASLGTLVGFTVNAAGTDFILSARAEEFPNRPQGDFVEQIHKQWRADTLRLYSSGRGTELNRDTYAEWPVYGVTNSGTGRLIAAGGHLAAVFSRRMFGPDGLIHQVASDLLMDEDLSGVPVRAGNVVSHSFDQRLIFDGKDFVTLHQADQYPCPGLIIEKVRAGLGRGPRIARFPAYTCPTFGNDVFFELGGLAAEPDGYPVLFTTTRNTKPVNAANVGPMQRQAWDVAMVYVLRDFDKQPRPPNRFDIVASGILASGFAPDQEFTLEGFTWNPQTSRFDKPETRVINRRVYWVTNYPATLRATHAKFTKLQDGQYIAVWEEHAFEDDKWRYRTTRAQVLTSSSGNGNAKSLSQGRLVELPGLRLPQGDDAITISLNGTPHAAWVTAGTTNRQLVLETLDGKLNHRSYALRLP